MSRCSAWAHSLLSRPPDKNSVNLVISADGVQQGRHVDAILSLEFISMSDFVYLCLCVYSHRWQIKWYTVCTFKWCKCSEGTPWARVWDIIVSHTATVPSCSYTHFSPVVVFMSYSSPLTAFFCVCGCTTLISAFSWIGQEGHGMTRCA